MQTPKFTRSQLADAATLERVVATGARQHLAEVVEAAGADLRRTYADLRLREPGGDAYAQFVRVLQARPASIAIVAGAHLHGVAESADPYYTMEE